MNQENPNETDMITFTKEGHDARFILRDIEDKEDYGLLREI